MKDLEGESDIDEEFRLGVDQAADKFGMKRKKKHLFNDGGVPIEPFNIKNDIREGTLTREGVFMMERDKKRARKEGPANDECEEEEDAWFASVQEDQAKMMFEKSQKQADSDASESEDDDGDSKSAGDASD